MNIDEVLAAFQFELRNLAWPGEALEPLPLITRRSRAGGYSNDVCAFALDESNVDAAIQEQIDYFGALGQSLEWKVFSFDKPTDLLDRLKIVGFTVGDREAVVIYDLADGLGPLEADAACEVHRVIAVEQLDDLRLVAEEAFGTDYSSTIRQLTEAFQTGQTGHDAYVAYVDGTPAAAGRLYNNPRSLFGGMYGGCTRPSFVDKVSTEP